MKKQMQALGEEVFDAVLERLPALRVGAKQYPVIDTWGIRADGVYLTQGFDEVWLTAKQARRLIVDLQELYPDKKRVR